MVCFVRQAYGARTTRGEKASFSKKAIEIQLLFFSGCRDSLGLFLTAGQTRGRARRGAVEFLASDTPHTITVPHKATKKGLQQEKNSEAGHSATRLGMPSLELERRPKKKPKLPNAQRPRPKRPE